MIGLVLMLCAATAVNKKLVITYQDVASLCVNNYPSAWIFRANSLIEETTKTIGDLTTRISTITELLNNEGDQVDKSTQNLNLLQERERHELKKKRNASQEKLHFLQLLGSLPQTSSTIDEIKHLSLEELAQLCEQAAPAGDRNEWVKSVFKGIRTFKTLIKTEEKKIKKQLKKDKQYNKQKNVDTVDGDKVDGPDLVPLRKEKAKLMDKKEFLKALKNVLWTSLSWFEKRFSWISSFFP
eukprot:GEMP01072183.1.p1 GENE.GEMP01072183.1~~GEMP01072183.1.p1  ORF type:complete len:240 (+),score=24.03 GEMP01072183.1:165-884(+)